jgi:uncharacterized membrane-anchored protein
MVTVLVAGLVVLVIAVVARWVRDRCGELDVNLFGPTTTPPTGSSS